MITQHTYTPVARSYAQALFGAARRLGIMQRAQEEAKSLLKIIEQNPKLLTLLENPRSPEEDKLAVLDKVFRGRLSQLLMNLLHTLINRHRSGNLAEILRLFLELCEQAEGIFQATVTSAYQLSFQDKLKLKTALEKYTKARLKIDYDVDPNLLGGIVFRFRDTLVDSSIRTGLNELKRLLLNTQIRVDGA